MQNPIISLRNFRNHEFGYPIPENTGGGCTFDKELEQFFKEVVNDAGIIGYNGIFTSIEHPDNSTNVIFHTFNVRTGSRFVEFDCTLTANFLPLGPNGEDYSQDRYTNGSDNWTINNEFLVKCIENKWIDTIYEGGNIAIKGEDINNSAEVPFNKPMVNLYYGHDTETYNFRITFKDVCGNKRPNQPYIEKDWNAIYNIEFNPNGFPEVLSFQSRIGYLDKDGIFQTRDVNDYDKEKFKYLPGGGVHPAHIKVDNLYKNQSFIYTIDASDYQLGSLHSNPETGISYSGEGYPGLIDRNTGAYSHYQYMGEYQFWNDLRTKNYFEHPYDNDKEIYLNKFTILYVAKAPEDEKVKNDINLYIQRPNNVRGGWDAMVKLISGRVPKLGGNPGEFVEIPELFPCLVLCDTKSGNYGFIPAWMVEQNPSRGHLNIRLDNVRSNSDPMLREFPTEPNGIKQYIPPQYHSQIDEHQL